MFCTKCGTKASEGAAFCPKCGHSFGSGHGMAMTQHSPQQNIRKLKPLILGCAAIIVIITIVALTQCSSRGLESALVGTWTSDMNPGYRYTFHENGQGTRGESVFIESFIWRVESGNTVVMTFGFREERWDAVLLGGGNRIQFSNGPLPGVFPFTRVR